VFYFLLGMPMATHLLSKYATAKQHLSPSLTLKIITFGGGFFCWFWQYWGLKSGSHTC
jgi:hypothetical protein